MCDAMKKASRPQRNGVKDNYTAKMEEFLFLAPNVTLDNFMVIKSKPFFHGQNCYKMAAQSVTLQLWIAVYYCRIASFLLFWFKIRTQPWTAHKSTLEIFIIPVEKLDACLDSVALCTVSTHMGTLALFFTISTWLRPNQSELAFLWVECRWKEQR